MNMRHTGLPMRLDSPEADLIFTALGNKTRRRILQRLSEKPARSISELAREFGISSTSVSNQVAILEKAGLVSRIQHGKYQKAVVCDKAMKIISEMLNEVSQKIPFE